MTRPAGPREQHDVRRAPHAFVQVAQHSVRVRVDLPLVLFDVLFVCAAYGGALALRFEGLVPAQYWHAFLAFLPIAVPVHIVTNALAGLYGRVWHHAGIDDARRVVAAGGASIAILGVAFLLVDRLLPISVVVPGGLATLLLIGLLRFQYRLFAFQRQRQREGESRVIVLGAGQAGSQLVRDLLRESHGMRPVAILDDAPGKHRRSLAGLPIVGPLVDLPQVAREQSARIALLAIPSAPQELVRSVTDMAFAAELELKVLPSVAEFLGRRVSARDLRDVSITDLLGRQQVQTDLETVSNLLNGRRVLITGGGGSIGAEIARQVATCGPAELVLLDHDETHLFDAATALGNECALELGSVRDHGSLRAIFARRRPEVVFHAAALKHVPMLEEHAGEAFRTNVEGTQNVLAAAEEFGAERLVFISTDKAVNPSSVMGATKLIGEQLVLRGHGELSCCAVRFGNVLGSRGSVVPTFMRQLEAGGPLTVTHSEVTRFFMSIQEAVQLVLQAAALAQGAEIFMLDMGKPVKILDLARNMIRLGGYGEAIDVRVTGLRPGEKLAEELHSQGERPEPTLHPSIVRLNPKLHVGSDLDAALANIRDIVAQNDAAGVRRALMSLATRDAPAEEPSNLEAKFAGCGSPEVTVGREGRRGV